MKSIEIIQDHISAAANILGIQILDQCLDGVLSNTALFLRHASVVAGADDPGIDPAEMLRP